MVWVPLLVISNVVLFCMNFNFSTRVLWVSPSNIFNIANPDLSSMNGVLTLSISVCWASKLYYVPGIWAHTNLEI